MFSIPDKRKAGIIGSISFYVLSLLLPAIYVRNGADSQPYYSGIDVLLIGFFGVQEHNFAWFANLFYFTGLIFLAHDRAKISIPFFISALALGLTSFKIKAVWYNGGLSSVDGLGIAFYVWMFAFAVAIFTSIFAGKGLTSRSN